MKKIKQERNSLTSKHKITLDGLTIIESGLFIQQRENYRKSPLI